MSVTISQSISSVPDVWKEYNKQQTLEAIAAATAAVVSKTPAILPDAVQGKCRSTDNISFLIQVQKTILVFVNPSRIIVVIFQSLYVTRNSFNAIKPIRVLIVYHLYFDVFF